MPHELGLLPQGIVCSALPMLDAKTESFFSNRVEPH